MREGELVRKEIDGRTVYGIVGKDHENKRFVDLFVDQGTTNKKDYILEGWREAYNSDPMRLREQVMDIIEDRKSFFVSVAGSGIPDGCEYDVEEFYIEDKKRSEMFWKIYEAIKEWEWSHHTGLAMVSHIVEARDLPLPQTHTHAMPVRVNVTKAADKVI